MQSRTKSLLRTVSKKVFSHHSFLICLNYSQAINRKMEAAMSLLDKNHNKNRNTYVCRWLYMGNSEMNY